MAEEAVVGAGVQGRHGLVEVSVELAVAAFFAARSWRSQRSGDVVEHGGDVEGGQPLGQQPHDRFDIVFGECDAVRQRNQDVAATAGGAVGDRTPATFADPAQTQLHVGVDGSAVVMFGVEV
ncbi:hypothetical protein A9X06_32870 [Mycobacterium sp. 852002-51759_SCH5129042]|nr:hypothetical protein A9X06_32870 [Mycobacterium sp. 852002-51759_SCH5129042]